MFGIGVMELILIVSVALIVLGPKQLPEAARTLGGWFYRIKNTADSARLEIEQACNTAGEHQEEPSKRKGHE